MLNNPDDFDYLRHQLLTTSTDKIYNGTAKSSTTDRTSDKNLQNQLVQPTDNNEITKRKSLIIHKRHEQRLTQNQHHIHELWMRTFHETDVTNTALIVGTCLNRNLKQELMPKMIKYNRRAGINHETTTQRNMRLIEIFIMNINTNHNKETIQTPSQDAQGRWYDLLSPTQILTGQQPTTTAASEKKKKQPCNRKLRRYQRKLRKQGLDDATIRMYTLSNQLQEQDQAQDVDMEEIIPLNDTATLPGPYNPERTLKKRKRDASIVKSLSQLSMKEDLTKKKQRSSPKIQEQQHLENENIIQSNTNQQTTISLHYYLNVTDKKFKQMLKVAFASGEDILKWYRVYYFKLEQDLWQNYIVYGETYHCWTSSLSNTIIQQNQVTSDYQQSLKSTEKYQHKIKQQLQDAEEHVEQHALLLKNYQQQDSMVINEQ
ncbi:unnamed protein product [Rotaria socialis]|uniref:Uncharacterized protein n=1 Tax=Rotaria socialis TaxID=392032 RepID=A0A818BDD6_9BILA|nr:unnamed protein product [Rotaria socialis]